MAKNPIAPVAPGCTAFGPGFDIGAFAGGFFPKHGGNNVLGGGVLAEYFFCENFGIQGSYGAYATSSTHHQFDGDLVFRAPIRSLCIAPYILAGGGMQSNSSNLGSYHAGAGIEAHLGSFNIFADGAYHWVANDQNATIVRLGVKFPL